MKFSLESIFKDFPTGFLAFGLGLIALQSHLHAIDFRDKYSAIKPEKMHLEYVNQDSLLDVVYESGKIYLQQPDGSFVYYETILTQQKNRLDSLYQIEVNSLKQKYVGE
jgi:hypothetical protein